MLVWLTLPFYDFCGFRSVAVNSVYKLQFFYIFKLVISTLLNVVSPTFVSNYLAYFMTGVLENLM